MKYTVHAQINATSITLPKLHKNIADPLQVALERRGFAVKNKRGSKSCLIISRTPPNMRLDHPYAPNVDVNCGSIAFHSIPRSDAEVLQKMFKDHGIRTQTERAHRSVLIHLIVLLER